MNKKERELSETKIYIYSMNLRKKSEDWRFKNNKLKKDLHEELFKYSDEHVRRALKGNPSLVSMPILAEAVNSSVEDMTKVNYGTICQIIKERKEEKGYIIFFWSLLFMLYFTVIAFMSQDWKGILGILLCGYAMISNIEKNIWGIKVDIRKQYPKILLLLKGCIIAFMLLGFVVELMKKM